MFVKFNHPWGRYIPGDVANIELTLSRRLVGTGICDYREDKGMKTTPDFVVEEPVVSPSEELVEEPVVEEVEVEEKPKPVTEKKTPKRKYTRPEKAVSIEK